MSDLPPNLSQDIRKAASTLTLDDHHQQYMNWMMPVVDYYIDIYRHCLDIFESQISSVPSQSTIIDYGGGLGIFSMVAKAAGWGQVIYIDNDNHSVSAAEALSEATNLRPDVFLCGDSVQLKQWCEREDVAPDAIAGMDVIEHIYCLDDFFNDILTIRSASPHLLFTTASNPQNRRVCRRLHKFMTGDETGSNEKPNFFTLRAEYIRDCFPDMSEKEVKRWAAQTRGLIYDDVFRAVESRTPNLLADKYNTCDPRTGSWTERILPLDDYRQLLIPYDYTLTVDNGWFNTHHWFLKRQIAKLLNHINSIRLAPFIILSARHQ